ncbi:PREDICTED: granulocyte colony-stimulating factor [Chinchilla lanigera]|uniref:Granulocyte colony-stimulating factor n=1 Tax=Chinchilla lanigera TaxID=34839 RepID=A0A8C2W0J5_CHILA|nr:PREDICTED: granulocyte colony-stimulating factor [Chinchilla lanigera]
MARAAAQSPARMMALLLLLLKHSALWRGHEAAPLDPASPPSLPLPRSFVLKCLEQARRAQAEAVAMQEKLCAMHKLCHPEELALLGHSLGIPWAHLRSCSSQDLQLASCLRQLQAGLLLYQGLLQALAGVSPELSPTVDTLQLDVADFATTVWQQMEELGVAPATQPMQGIMPTFTSAFQRQAGGVLVASHLQSFLELAYRTLRYLTGP